MRVSVSRSIGCYVKIEIPSPDGHLQLLVRSFDFSPSPKTSDEMETCRVIVVSSSPPAPAASVYNLELPRIFGDGTTTTTATEVTAPTEFGGIDLPASPFRASR